MIKDKRMPSVVHYDGYTRELALASVGEGWAKLVNEAFDQLAHIKGNIKIIQVKEKWGGLRIYTDYSNHLYDKKVRELEERSFHICEVCGNPGNLRGGGWYRTLCAEHGGDKPIVATNDKVIQSES